jgi:serpin B
MDAVTAESDLRASKINKDLVSRNIRFSLNILKELQREDKDKNIFISPLSISMALAMLYYGAEGHTKEAIANALQIKEMPPTDINEEFRDLMGSLDDVDNHVSLSIANSIWVKKVLESSINDAFKRDLATYFKSEVLPRQFSDPATVNEINDWVKTKTGGKIDKIIEYIPRDAVMFIINAIYFKGEWLQKFDEKQTRMRNFHLENRKSIKKKMMSTTKKFHYGTCEGLQIVRMPYGRDKIAMYILLPDEGANLNSLVNDIDPDKLEDIFLKMKKIELEIQLPKLKLEYGKKQLNDALTRLGMGDAFDGETANFRAIASLDSGNLFVSFVDHKAVVEVNEMGTEAAAVTNIGIKLSSMSITTQRFIVNKPYLFMIRDDRSGLILFIGKIVEPLQ